MKMCSKQLTNNLQSNLSIPTEITLQSQINVDVKNALQVNHLRLQSRHAFKLLDIILQEKKMEQIK